MQKASLILNILLLLAVAYLYIDRFSGAAPDSLAAGQAPAGGETPRLVYINADTLLRQYDYFRGRMEELAQREQAAEAELQTKGQALEREVRKIQQQIQEGLLAPNQIQREEQRIGQQQQVLMAERDRVSQELLEAQQVLQAELAEDLKALLADLRQERGYDFILSYAPGTAVLMANDHLDITQAVLTRLNAAKGK